MVWHWVEYSPSGNFQVGGSGVWLFVVVAGEIDITLRLSYKGLHGAVSLGAGGYGYEGGSDGCASVKPTITYQARGWDATIGYALGSDPDPEILSHRRFSLVRLGLTEHLSLFFEAQHYGIEGEDSGVNYFRGYVLPAIRYQAGGVSLDFGVFAVYDLEQLDDELSYKIESITPLPCTGASVGF